MRKVAPTTLPAQGLKSHLGLGAGALIESLGRGALFAGLPEAAIRRVAARGTVHTYPAGRVLWRAGSDIDHILVVLEGRVRVVRSTAGRQHVIHTEGPGGTLGEVPLFAGGRAPASAIAAVPTRCLAISRAALEELMTADSRVAWIFLRRLAERVRELVQRIDDLAARGATARLARYLVAHVPPDDDVVALGMSQSELAEELGTVREVVVRALRHLRRVGAIQSVRGGIRIADLSVLRAAAGGA